MPMRNERVRQLVELLPQIIWVADSAGHVEFVNTQWTRFTGLSFEESLGEGANRCIHPDDQDAVQEAWVTAIQTGQPFETETRIRRADGEYEWFLSRCVPIIDEAEGTVRWFGTSTNIDRRKHAEQDQEFITDLIAALRQMRNPDNISARLAEALCSYLELDVCLLLTFHEKTKETQLLAQAYSRHMQDQTLHSNGAATDAATTPDQASARPLPPTTLVGTNHNQRHYIANVTQLEASEWQPLGRFLAQRLGSDREPIAFANLEPYPQLHSLNITALIAATAANSWQDDENIKVYLIGGYAREHHWRAPERNLFQSLASSAWLTYQRAITELTLRREQATLELALDMAKMGIWEYDYATKMVIRSPSMDRMFGLPYDSPQRMVEDYYARIHPEDRKQVRGAVAHARNSDAPFAIEYRIVLPEGQTFWVAGRGAVVRDAQGNALRLSGALVDITERKHAEQYLRESEERFRLALEDSPITVYTADMDLRYTWVFNPPRRRTVEDMMGRRDDEIYTPAGARDLIQFKRDVLAGGRLMRRVVEVADEQGYTRYDLSAVPIRDAHGTITGLTVAAADTTERERAETRLAFLAEASELLTASLDYNETLERLAQALVPRLANWCAVDLVNGDEVEQVVVAHEDPEMVMWAHELREKYPPDPERSQGVFQVIRTGRPEFYPYLPQETLKASARDEEHWRIIQQLGFRSAMIVPLRLRERVLGAITLVWSESQRNYTEADLRFAEELARRAAIAIENSRLYQAAREAEANLRVANENLERRVHERTIELERSNEELDRFAYVASHDLKAPLRAIEHLATWIEEDAGSVLPPSSTDHLHKIRGRISRMEALLDDMLTYSRAGRVRGDASLIDLGDLIQTVIETVAPPKGFQIDYPPDLPQLETYRAPLETVLRNLIGNAIKHHPSQDQEGRIEIGVVERGEWIEFCVDDDGEGIAPEFHERIFQMFQTLRPRDQIEGSGVGLAVVKKIVEGVGGAIRVESQPGQGVSFYFTWPKVWRG